VNTSALFLTLMTYIQNKNTIRVHSIAFKSLLEKFIEGNNTRHCYKNVFTETSLFMCLVCITKGQIKFNASNAIFNCLPSYSKSVKQKVNLH